MPPKRRIGSAKSQSTLSFHGTRSSNRISKPGKTSTGKTSSPYFKALSAENTDSDTSTLSTSNKTKTDPLISESIVRTNLSAASDPDLEEPTTAEAALLEQIQAERTRQAQTQLTPEEQAALQVSEAQIKRYWREKEKLRKAPRVHQEGLSVHEKVLREWDVSSHFGPSIGITRQKRWKRAHKLGLNPPIEILAVLLREQDQQNLGAERSHIDDLMSSRFVET